MDYLVIQKFEKEELVHYNGIIAKILELNQDSCIIDCGKHPLIFKNDNTYTVKVCYEQINKLNTTLISEILSNIEDKNEDIIKGIFYTLEYLKNKNLLYCDSIDLQYILKKLFMNN
jgi:hypothetical protein